MPNVARGLRRVKTETDKEKNKVECDERSARKDGNKGKLRLKKGRNQRKEKTDAKI